MSYWLPWIIFGVVALLSYLAQWNLNHKFQNYSAAMLGSALTGREVAERMLSENGISGVSVTHIKGSLTDHFNPLNRTVNLSESVYSSRSVAAAAVAAHECGHALQHAVGYAPLKMRSSLVPVVSFASRWVQWVILLGLLLLQVFPFLLFAGIVLFALTTLFSFITLPVEIDASRRAIAWLHSSNVATTGVEMEMAESALRAAAYTYVVAALGSLATLVYYVMIYVSGRDR